MSEAPTNRQTITITYEDGSVQEVETRQFDMVKAERHFGQPVPALMDVNQKEGGARFEVMFYLGYIAATRGDQNPPDFDTWGDSVAQLDFGDDPDAQDEGEAVPLDRTQ